MSRKSKEQYFNLLIPAAFDEFIKTHRNITASNACFSRVVSVVASCSQKSLFVTDDIMRDIQQDMTIQFSQNVFGPQPHILVSLGIVSDITSINI